MPSLFRRHADEPTDTDASDETSEASTDDARPRSYTASKGRPTPKRRDAQRRSAEPPPSDRKEAARRLRERQRKERVEARQKMMAGDERYLPARDRGEERGLVRNVVDARRNIGSYFLIAALVILIGTSSGMPPGIQFGAQILWYALALLFIVDCIVLARKIRKLVRSRYPKSTQRMGGLYLYGVMRSITFRKMRMPSPKVKLGDQV
ncbi:MAG: DUF3043 domain-containing protein [Actinocatenispora sp.]